MLPDETWDEPRFQLWVVATARANGWRVRVMDVRSGGARLRRGDAESRGFPDLLFIRELIRDPERNAIFWAELKDAHKDLRPDQDEVVQLLRNAGAEVHVWRPTDWEQIMERL